jgi:hypothetical protein
MSKARDLANAGTALITVSPTELGYLDGVTSAVQTQIDAKEATLPSQTGNSGKYLTTDGSSKSWGTVSQYSLPSQSGNSGKFLTTDGTAESWGTPTAAPTNFTLVGSVSLSGTNICTISGISGANQIMIQFDSLTVQQQSFIYIRFNGDTGSNYRFNGTQISNNGSWSLSTTSTWAQLQSAENKIQITRTSTSTGSQADGYLFMDGCNSSGKKFFHGLGGARQDGAGTTQYNWLGGYWDNSSTVTSVSIENSTLNMSGGLMRIFKA